MGPREFIRNSVFSQCQGLKLTNSECEAQANEAVTKYDRNQYQGKPFDLIKAQLVLAKKTTELGGKK